VTTSILRPPPKPFMSIEQPIVVDVDGLTNRILLKPPSSPGPGVSEDSAGPVLETRAWMRHGKIADDDRA